MTARKTIDILGDFDVSLYDNAKPASKEVDGVLYVSPNFGPTPTITVKSVLVEVVDAS